jgi:hypothetical protein
MLARDVRGVSNLPACLLETYKPIVAFEQLSIQNENRFDLSKLMHVPTGTAFLKLLHPTFCIFDPVKPLRFAPGIAQGIFPLCSP